MAAFRLVLAACLCAVVGMKASIAETSSVIDPTESADLPRPPAAVRKPAQADPALKRERQRAAAEQRRRAKAEARAAAAEKESERLRALEQARASAAAAREAAARAAARKAAAARAAAARAAAQSAARLAARKEAAARELAAREAMAREAAARELAAREAAAKEAAAKEAALREAAAREAAAKETAAKEAEAREAKLREAAAREAALRAAAAREAADRLIAVRQASAREQRALKLLPAVGKAFRDCGDCPEMIWLPQGAFALGEAGDGGTRPRVSIQHPLAVGRFEVTFAEWDACVAGGGCRNRAYDSGWGRGSQPVINVSWLDARQYTAWLSRVTNHAYRLLTEAEWEYAARAGTDARYWWGDRPGRGDANCADCGSRWDGRQAAPIGRFAPNPFGLYDMHGNVAEWVEDCYHDRLRDTPSDGRAWAACTSSAEARVVRGGAWYASARSMRSSFRTSAASGHTDNGIGFRVARTESP